MACQNIVLLELFEDRCVTNQNVVHFEVIINIPKLMNFFDASYELKAHLNDCLETQVIL